MNYSDPVIRKRRRRIKVICRVICKIAILLTIIAVIKSMISENVTIAKPVEDTNTVVEIEQIVEVPEEKEMKVPRIDCKLDAETQQMIYEKCEEYDVDFSLCMAMIQHESGFNADVISKTNDYGLMQINKCNHEWLKKTLGITDLLDPEDNVEAGLYMISNLLKKYEPAKALMAYNMGEGGAKKHWDKGEYTSKYAEAIIAKANEYKERIQNDQM